MTQIKLIKKQNTVLEREIRLKNFFKEFLEPEEFEFTTFESKGSGVVCVENISFYSLCEHHGLPYFGKATIAYQPNELICGLSKIPRLVRFIASSYSTQEHLNRKIYDFLIDNLKPKKLIVKMKARHLCIEMRGVRESVTTQTWECFGFDLSDFKVEDP